jgi:FkbM family methyltransferase
MSVLGLLTPEYILRPQQIPLRLWRGLRARSDTFKIVRLPWGSDLRVNIHDSIGWSIYTSAIYETAVTETLWRLTKPSDSVADIGANIGYMASILSARVGRSGKVYCFEPHPQMAAELRSNIALWRYGQSCSVWQAAVGESSGPGSLFVPEYFSHNHGISSLSPRNDIGTNTEIPIDIVALDDVIPKAASLAVVKIDVEGHELSVFKGMQNILESHRVHYIVFEEIAPFPAPTHAFLKDRGYATYGIEHQLSGIRFTPSNQPTTNDIPVYLATREPPEVLKRIQQAFWQSFGPNSLLNNRVTS